ncbi:MAG: hypothetical protein HYT40_01630 [Candidatus Sungbacteria bacterium]|uniref:Alpha/beta hydrolase n=1 Tax=Candidatus Sungiibacteriota bacterium TaxID=2750080 RepID=A0A931SDS0_9BACT|nr:hypothetical protein [Candidatus Sungbacteria bacterium]
MIKKLGHWVADYGYLFRGKLHPIWRHTPPDHYLGYVLAHKNPVILIPGITSKWHFLKYIGDALSYQGHPVYVIKELGYMMGEVPKLARIVRDFIEERDLRNVVMVCHSKGGLVGKYILAFQNADARVKKVIAVATPFLGSHMVKLIPYQNYKELLPESELVRDLDTKQDVNRSITSIYGFWDNHIWPTTHAHLEGAKNIQVPVYGHHKILFDQRVKDIVLTEVDV